MMTAEALFENAVAAQAGLMMGINSAALAKSDIGTRTKLQIEELKI
jgi:hypothetical protein